MPRTLLLSLFVLALPGCLFSDRRANVPIDAVAVASLVPGESTSADVAAMLGAPTDVVQLGHNSAWRYDHTVERQVGLVLILLNLRGVDTKADRVWVFFDAQGVLTHVGATLEAELAEYDLPIF